MQPGDRVDVRQRPAIEWEPATFVAARNVRRVLARKVDWQRYVTVRLDTGREIEVHIHDVRVHHTPFSRARAKVLSLLREGV